MAIGGAVAAAASTLFAWLIRAIGPIVAKVLVALGLTMITVKGVDIAFSEVDEKLRTTLNGLPHDVIQIMGLFGVNDGISIVLASASFVVSYYMAGRFFSFFGAAK